MTTAKTQDFTTMLKDMMGKFSVDTTAMDGMFKAPAMDEMFKTPAMDDMFKNQSALAEKMSSVALEAAKQSAELSAKWTQGTLAKVTDMSQSKQEPADFAKTVSDFAAASAETAAENMAAFAEIAKKAQSETLELVMAAGKDLTEEATAAAEKATASVKTAAKKATAK
ncbi:MAG: Phasin [Rhodobacteraceae bacterium]|nr:Phasin [Paracoccaceae bacterium]